MTSFLRRTPTLIGCTVVLAVASTSLLFTSAWLGLGATKDPNVPGFLQKSNWSLQVLFWPVLAILVHKSWHQYVKAWQELPSRGLLFRERTVDRNASSVTPLLSWLAGKRPLLVALSVVLGLILTAIDAGCLWAEYGEISSPRASCTEPDFSIAFRLSSAFPAITQSANGWFVVCAYLLQGAIIAYGCIALMQITLHSYSFMRFEVLRVARADSLSLLLDYRDPDREFGLADVNRAINTTYVCIALAMALPVLSAYWNPEPDLGQWMLRILLPLIVLFPALIPFMERSTRVAEASDRMRRDPDPKAEEQFAKQSLWPFEKTQIGYIGKIAAALALGEYIYLITKNIKSIL